MDTSLTHRPTQQFKPDQTRQEQTEEVRPSIEHFPASSSKHWYLNVLQSFLNDFCGARDLSGPDGRIRNHCQLPWGLTPLHIACLSKDESLLAEALRDARFNVCIDDRTNKTSLNSPATAIAPPDMLDRINDCSPLHFALLNGWNEGALMLFDAYDEQIKVLTCTANHSGSTVLSMAAANCDLNVVKWLCEYFETSSDYESFLHHMTPDGRNLLHHAAQQDDPAVYRYLRLQMLRTYEASLAEGRNKARSPVTVESLRDRDGKTPIDMIRERVGASYVNHLDSDEGMRYKKVNQNNWEGEWECFYVREYHGNRISWVMPWEQCRLV